MYLLLLDVVVPFQYLMLCQLQCQDREQSDFTSKHNFRCKNTSPSRNERTIGKNIAKFFAVGSYMLHNLAIVAFKSQTSSQKIMYRWLWHV